MLDIFNQDAFSLVSLTDAINNIKFVPGRIGQLGIFSTKAVSTTTIAIEEKHGQLSLVAPSPRGGVGKNSAKQKRVSRNLTIPHFQIDDAVIADEIQNIRAFGSESTLESLARKIGERMAELSDSLAVTEEHARVGAIKGVVTYVDGSSLDLFREFEVTPEPEIAFNFATLKDGKLRQKCSAIIRKLANILGGASFGGVHAFCGDDFFDQLIANPEVRETYLNWNAASELREAYVDGNQSFGAFTFGGINWENYRGQQGDKPFIDSNKCHIFPTGVPGLFRTAYAPADYVETVNTLGRRLYVRQRPMANEKGIQIQAQMNALQYCTRPQVLLHGSSK